MTGRILGMLALLGAHTGGLIEPPATSLLRMPLRGASRKPPVPFSHRLHETRRVACTQCHHEYEGRRNVWRQDQPVQQCKGCHLRLKQQGRPTGPVECRGCHRSQS